MKKLPFITPVLVRVHQHIHFIEDQPLQGHGSKFHVSTSPEPSLFSLTEKLLLQFLENFPLKQNSEPSSQNEVYLCTNFPGQEAVNTTILYGAQLPSYIEKELYLSFNYQFSSCSHCTNPTNPQQSQSKLFFIPLP